MQIRSARPERSSRSGRALLAFAAITGASGLVLLGVAVAAPRDDGSVIDATPATAVSVPETVAPLMPTRSAAPPRPTPTPTPIEPDRPGSTVPTATTVPLSPLAELLGPTGSAIPDDPEPRVRPASITIDDLELWGPVRAVGLEDDGQLEVPDETEIGWYQYGSAPGLPGATVLAAHVTWNRSIGPFFRLRDLDPGATVEVRLEDGTQRTYEVVERAIYDKDELPRNRIWRTSGDETLVLITCGGSFNPDIRRYRQNVVVYAVPVA